MTLRPTPPQVSFQESFRWSSRLSILTENLVWMLWNFLICSCRPVVIYSIVNSLQGPINRLCESGSYETQIRSHCTIVLLIRKCHPCGPHTYYHTITRLYSRICWRFDWPLVLYRPICDQSFGFVYVPFTGLLFVTASPTGIFSVNEHVVHWNNIYVSAFEPIWLAWWGPVALHLCFGEKDCSLQNGTSAQCDDE